MSNHIEKAKSSLSVFLPGSGQLPPSKVAVAQAHATIAVAEQLARIADHLENFVPNAFGSVSVTITD